VDYVDYNGVDDIPAVTQFALSIGFNVTFNAFIPDGGDAEHPTLRVKVSRNGANEVNPDTGRVLMWDGILLYDLSPEEFAAKCEVAS
jgi:hypothetical protein